MSYENAMFQLAKKTSSYTTRKISLLSRSTEFHPERLSCWDVDTAPETLRQCLCVVRYLCETKGFKHRFVWSDAQSAASQNYNES